MLSQFLLNPDIDLTSEQSQWLDVELIYRQMAFDEFQFTDRGKYFAVKWLLESKKWPQFIVWAHQRDQENNRWHWFDKSHIVEGVDIGHAIIFPEAWPMSNTDEDEYADGHGTFGSSILWFCSLWPRFYVEAILPEQENEPANPDEFWENLGLCVPGEDWETFSYLVKDNLGRWKDEGKYSTQQPYYDACDDLHYRWTFGNGVVRSIKAWRGESE